MKQTNRAITFLMAQYRAIFKHAYLKGLVSAAVLTAGLAVGSTANAAATPLSGAAALSGDAITINGIGDGTSGSYSFIQINSKEESDNVTNNGIDGTITITSGSADVTGEAETGNYIIANTKSITLSGSGTLTISGSTDNVGLALVGDDKALSVTLGTINVDKGSLNIVAGKSGSSGTATVSAGAVTLGTAGGASQGILSLSGGEALATFGASGTTLLTAYSGSQISLNGNSTLAVKTLNLSGTIVNLTGEEANTFKGALSSGSSSTINVSGSEDTIDIYTAEDQNATVNINVADGASGSMVFSSEESKKLSLINSKFDIQGDLTITSGTVSLSGDTSSVVVGKGGSLTIEAKDGEANAKAASLTSTLFNLQEGEITVTGASGSSATIAGRLQNNSSGSITTNSGTFLNLYTSSSDYATLNIDVADGSNATISLSDENNNSLTLSGGAINLSGSLTIAEGNVTLNNVDLTGEQAYSDSNGDNFITVGEENKVATLTVTDSKLETYLTTETNSGSITLGSSGSLIVDGTLTLGDETVSIKLTSGDAAGGAIKLAETSQITADTLSLKGEASSDESGITTNIKAGILSYDYEADATTKLNTIVVTQELTNTAEAAIHDSIKLQAEDESGSITGSKPFTISGTGSLDVKGAWTSTTGINANIANAIKFTESGSLTFSGSGSTLTIGNKDAITSNNGNGTVTIADKGTLAIKIGSTDNFSSDVVSLTAGSTLDVQAGNFVVSSDKNFTADKVTVSGATDGYIVASNGATVSYDKMGQDKLNWKATSGSTLATSKLSGSVANTIAKFDVDPTSTLELDSLSLSGDAAIEVNASNASKMLGTLQVNTSLSANQTLTFATGKLQLGDEFGGSVGTFNQDLTIANTANVYGTWTEALDADKKTIPLLLTVSGAGSLTVGGNEVATDLTVSKIADTTTSKSGITVNKGATLTVNGVVTKAPASTGEETLAESTGDEFKPGDNGHYGFSLSGATVNVDGGTFVIGSTAAVVGGILTAEKWETEVATPATGEQGFVYDNFGQYKLSNGGTLKVDFAERTFTLNELKQLKHELISGVGVDGVISGGFLDLGSASLDSIKDAIDENQEITWNEYQAAQTGGAQGVIIDELANATVTGLTSSDSFYGAAGAVQTDGTQQDLVIGNDTQLVNASLNDQNAFVTDSKGNVVGIDVSTPGAVVDLKGNGQVGTITLVAGTEGDETVLNLDQARNPTAGESYTITVAGISAEQDLSAGNNGIQEYTVVNVDQNVTAKFTNSVTVDTLNALGNVDANKQDVKTNSFTSSADTDLSAKNLTINEFADIKGSVNVAENMTIASTTLEDPEDVNSDIVQAVVAGTVSVGKDLTATRVDFTNEVTVGKTLTATNATFSNKVGAEELTASGSTFSKEVTVTKTLTATDVTFDSGTAVETKDAVFTGTTTDVNGELTGGNTIAGSFNATGTVTFGVAQGEGTDPASGADVVVAGTLGAKDIKFAEGAQSELNIADGSVSAETLVANAGVTINVGADGDDDTTGTLDVVASNLNGAAIYVDPSYDKTTAIYATQQLSGYDKKHPEVLGTWDGPLFVGQNAAAGFGVDATTLRAIIAQYQENGHFVDPAKGGEYGSMLYADKPFKIDNRYGIILTAGTKQDLVDHVTDSAPAAGTAMDGYTLGKVVANTIYFGENTALGINTKNIKTDGSAFITFVDNTDPANPQNVAGTLVADGGQIVLFGDNYKKSYQLFEEGVKLQDITGATGTEIDGIKVVSANGLLETTITAQEDGTITGDVELGLSESGSAVFMANASAPVQTTLVAYLNGYNGEWSDVEAEVDYLYTYKDGAESRDYNNYFLSRIVMGGTATDAEKVARLGVYGGTHQAALAAGSSTTEAVAGRMGVGAQTGSITFADNGQGAGLWVSPIYKNHDSDGFGAQGVSYGADLDMYGVALGGDFTMANGVRLGAAFNVGSGDADGQGAGAGVSNDFDYYGFSIYGGFTSGAMSVVGDISYTVVDNDITGNTAVERVSASMDSTNLSFGVTGAYALDLNGFNVTPHAGLRFTQIDMDDYTVKGEGDIAKYSADSANIFSIPVGVTFSKEIVTGSWTVKPALDLTLTANMGDDSVDGTVAWAGVENLKTNVESEVIDSFTYGANLGIAAKSGNFSFGFGLNYTGASNADEYGVNANARFVF